MENSELFDRLSDACVRLGADRAAVISVSNVKLDAAFRDMCAANLCGMWGRCYMCPPDLGDIDTLMEKAREYGYALVYQSISSLEDSFDFEGMEAAKRKSNGIAISLREAVSGAGVAKMLALGAGGCGVCEECAKREGVPCRFPKLALPSLEAYGFDVAQLAKLCDMKYTNGPDTVTYFGAVLFSL